MDDSTSNLFRVPKSSGAGVLRLKSKCKDGKKVKKLKSVNIPSSAGQKRNISALDTPGLNVGKGDNDSSTLGDTVRAENSKIACCTTHYTETVGHDHDKSKHSNPSSKTGSSDEQCMNPNVNVDSDSNDHVALASTTNSIHSSRSAYSREPKSKHNDNGDTVVVVSGKTVSELHFEQRKRDRLSQRLQRQGVKTHKQRVEEFNQYLSRLSEHHDMPRIGPG